MTSTDKPQDQPRHHTDAPAEGQPDGWVAEDTGSHSQDPAEGPDTDEGDAPASNSK